MTSRPIRVSEVNGAAAGAIRSARQGHAVDVLSRGHVVARIVPPMNAPEGVPGLTIVPAEGRLVPPRRRIRTEASVLDQLDDDRNQ